MCILSLTTTGYISSLEKMIKNFAKKIIQFHNIIDFFVSLIECPARFPNVSGGHFMSLQGRHMFSYTIDLDLKVPGLPHSTWQVVHLGHRHGFPSQGSLLHSISLIFIPDSSISLTFLFVTLVRCSSTFLSMERSFPLSSWHKHQSGGLLTRFCYVLAWSWSCHLPSLTLVLPCRCDVVLLLALSVLVPVPLLQQFYHCSSLLGLVLSPVDWYPTLVGPGSSTFITLQPCQQDGPGLAP